MSPEAMPIRLTTTCSVVNAENDNPKIMAPLPEDPEDRRLSG
jgi:hypothetical protein